MNSYIIDLNCNVAIYAFHFRVMVDQLSKQNTQLTQNHQSAHLALQRLLQERQQMKEWLTQTHR